MTLQVERADLVPADLPNWRALLDEGRRAAMTVDRRRTLFHELHKVRSQREWGGRQRRSGHVRTVMNIGLSSWPATREGLQEVWERFAAEGLAPPDSFLLILERRMGLPSELREKAPRETGPALWADSDWVELGQTVPIQPQLPAIGSPASFENTLKALAAGVDMVGNFANFVLRWMYWEDDVSQLSSVLRALGALSAHRREGVVLDSYLEDGHAGMYTDYRSIVGWSLFERYLAQDLCGVAYAADFGGLTADPFLRAEVIYALEIARRAASSPPGYYHGDTVGYTDSGTGNLAHFANDVLVNSAAQLAFATGAAVLPVPLSERERIPTIEEILEVHLLARASEGNAAQLATRIDWEPIQARGRLILDGGRRWFRNLIAALNTMGIDTANPLEIMLAVRKLGAGATESIGLDSLPPLDARTPLADMAREAIDAATTVVRFGADGLSLDGHTVLVASTDVHEFAKRVLASVLVDRGARVVDCGLSVDPEPLVDRAERLGATAIVVTTHNGWALNFGRRLSTERAVRGCGAMLVMGGVLNEDVDGGPIPRDVTPDLAALGILATNDFVDLVRHLAAGPAGAGDARG